MIRGQIRSALFLPGSNARAIAKASTLPADAILFDLEDSVGGTEKELAGRQVAEALAVPHGGGAKRLVRVNGAGHPAQAAELAMAVRAGADGVLLPKIETPAEILSIDRQLTELGAPAGFALWAMIETPLGVLSVAGIAATASDTRLGALAVGPNDLVKATGLLPGADRANLQPWLLAIVLAARAHGLLVLDGVFNAFRDEAGFARECESGRALGFDGKTLIHPGQIPAANAIFGPTAAEIAWAEKIVAAFAEPGREAVSVIALEGEMVERLHLESAQALLAGLARQAEREGRAAG